MSTSTHSPPPGFDLPRIEEGPPTSITTQVAVPGLIVADVSWSMFDALVSARLALMGLVEDLKNHPIVAEQAQMAIVTFADTALTVLGFSPLADPAVTVPELHARGNGTNYEAALAEVRRLLQEGLRALATSPDGAKRVVYRPTVYFISDGQPNCGGDWEAQLQAIRALPVRPNIMAFGFADADRSTILRIADEGMAYFAHDGQTPSAVFDQILQVILNTLVTVTQGVAGGQATGAVFDPSTSAATSGLVLLDKVDVT
ncbi:MAG TPA: VWA domain-containing protein [Iamia sp.]|jgi:uncharacterized protein YegL|nr:VWA domain-containing protein [Iamia sp.]